MTVQEFGLSLSSEVGKVIAGQRAAIEQATVALLADGHVLLEGVPGVAKTLLVRTLARATSLDYGRVQFTPDLMPSDVVGAMVFDPKSLEFRLRKGPIFANLLLADEINRTPPKTQSALLEAMEERSVTIDLDTQPLPKPFLVFATQNPIDFEGTYPLPEAQQDRFLLKVVVDYPEPEHEIDMLKRHHAGFSPQNLEAAGVRQIADAATIIGLRAQVVAETVEDKIHDYVYGIVQATRKSGDLLLGGSPRACIALLNAAKAVAALRGRDFVIPDDVKEYAMAVLRHRVILRPEAEVEGVAVDHVVATAIASQAVPR